MFKKTQYPNIAVINVHLKRPENPNTSSVSLVNELKIRKQSLKINFKIGTFTVGAFCQFYETLLVPN
jgi:hypothetical protein